MKTFFCRSTTIGLAAFLASGAALAQTAANCQGFGRSVDRVLQWRAVGAGLEFAQANVGSPNLSELVLVRYSNRTYRTRPFDLRDIVIARQRKGQFAPPNYSIAEVHGVFPEATVIATAGMTLSYSDPAPAGFLRSNGKTRSPVATKDKVLNGVVCLSRTDAPSILSSETTEGRRAPKNVGSCNEGFQAGPVLVADGAPTASKHGIRIPRVFFARSSDDLVIVGYSKAATTLALACGLASSSIAASAAIGLQSDSLGSLVIGPDFKTVAREEMTYGNIDLTVASALIIEHR